MRCCSISLYSSRGKLIDTFTVIATGRNFLKVGLSTACCKLVFVQEYSIILRSIKSEYSFPRDQERFRKRKFRYLRWQDKGKERNAAIVLRILAERGSSTIREIVENDGISDEKIDPKDRFSKYYTIIEGNKSTRVKGFIEKRLVRRARNEKPKKYELTVFGIFVAVHLYSEDNYPLSYGIPYDEFDKPVSLFAKESSTELSILELISRNYCNLFPLIFGKWDLLKKRIGSMVNVLINISHWPSQFDTSVSLFYNTRPLTLPTPIPLTSRYKKGIYHDEVTMLFFSYVMLNFPPLEFKHFIAENKEICEWYTDYFHNVATVKKEDSLWIDYSEALLKDDLVSAKMKWKEINKLQKIDQSHAESAFGP